MLLAVIDRNGAPIPVTSIADIERLARDPDAPQIIHDLRQLQLGAQERKRMRVALSNVSEEVRTLEQETDPQSRDFASRTSKRLRANMGSFCLG